MTAVFHSPLALFMIQAALIIALSRVVGVVVAPLRGDSHSAAGLRFGLKNIDGKSGVVPVVYHGENPPPLFKVGRNVVVSGSYLHGRLAGDNVVTKCPSKYTATKPA